MMSPRRNENVFMERIKLQSETRNLNLMLHSYFIRCYLVNSKERHMWFDEEIEDDCANEFLLRLIAEFPNNLYLPAQVITYKYQLEDNFSAYKCQHYEWWYLKTICKWMLPFLQNIEEKTVLSPDILRRLSFT